MVIRVNLAYWRKGAQNLHAVLSGERMRRVHAAEVGEAGGRVGWSPTQDVAQLRRVSIDGVPGHQELGGGDERRTRKYQSLNCINVHQDAFK